MKSKTITIFEQQVASIIQRVQILSNHSFVIDGEEIHIYNNQPYTQTGHDLGKFGSNNHHTPKEQRSSLLNSLINALYSKCYCHNSSTYQLPSIAERSAFMDTLSAANVSSNGLDLNWRIYHINPNGQAFAQKNGIFRQLLPNTFVYANSQQKQPILHQYVHFHRQKENRKAQAVFYYIYGNEYLGPEGNLVRIYWHIKPEGAAKLISEITNNLNFYKIPFNFKCLNHPNLYTRSDSAVLYLNKKHLAITQMMLPHLTQTLDPYLMDPVPMFTQPMSKGVSFAEDPGNGQSFGMSRISVLAEALIEGVQNKINSPKKLTDFVLNYMESKGMNRAHMYMNPRLQTT